MARSTKDLPRMQNQARTRAPLDRGREIVGQALAKTIGRAKPQMMRQYDLVERVRKYNPGVNEDLLNRAYVYAMKAHGEQKRASGDPYFSHPLEVAAILTDLKLDDATIAAALLHDTIEDTEATRTEIDQIFGKDIGKLVEGLTKLKRLDLVSREAKQAENLRKLLLAIADDVRVLLVKLADRLHNMRTLDHMQPEARRRVAEETLDIYAPLAARIGMYEAREELEELAFRELHPEAYLVISGRLDDMTERNSGLIGEIEQQLARKLADRGIAAQVKGRRKRAYSIWRKMERKAVGFEQLSDIFGFRVVVKTAVECYQALGIVHTTWPVVPGRFKDYISTPKQNDYRSIHTTVVGPSKQRVELQIRTTEMDEIAEYGIAAHALYKDAVGSPSEMLSRESNAYAWLRRTIGLLAEGSNPEEFLEHTKLELFHDQVFCFSPKGKLIALPRKATPIDFAYAVHTDIGNEAVGCKINGKIAPLVSELQNGDEVEILTSKAQTSPPVAWESIVVTGKARAAIRRATRSAVRHQYAGLGRRIVERLCQRAKREYSDERLTGALPRLARATIDDVFSAVGRQEMKASDVVRAMYPDYKEDRAPVAAAPKSESGWFGLRKAKAVMFKVPGEVHEGPIPIRGINSDLPVRFAPNGGAVPGDRIVGIMTPGQAITIYPIQSPALAEFEDTPDRWLDVRWDVDDNARRFPARIEVQSVNEPGSLAQIAQVIAEHDGNIDNIRMERQSPDFSSLTIDLEVYDLKHLTSIIAQLRAKKVVAGAERVTGRTCVAAPPPLRLGVNVDHVATLRNARGGRYPDPLHAAEIAIAGGADGITAHLREDRRHIRDDDLARLKRRISKPLNLEMASTREMVTIAVRTRPHAVCLVPERREERTTEGGLDVVAQQDQLAPVVQTLKAAGIRVSLFIAADTAQIEMAARLGVPVIEIHTGAWCEAVHAAKNAEAAAEFHRILAGARLARTLGLEVHAGHGLDYVTAEAIAALPEIAELNIGHYMIGEALFTGLSEVVKKMRTAIARGRQRAMTAARP